MTARTVLGPHGYSRPPYGSFAGKTPQVSTVTAVAGWVGRRPPTKRWWEELLEEYQAKYPRPPSKAKRAVAARRQVEERVEEAIADGLLTEFKPEMAEVVAKAMTAPTIKEALEYSAKAKAYINRMYEEYDEDDVMVMIWALD